MDNRIGHNTKNEVLVFRTVSIEKLDIVIEACRLRWPDTKFVVASNSGRCKELLSDPRISKVIEVKTGLKGFHKKLKIKQSFSAVVIPISNRYGAGYGNVFAASSRCNTTNWFVMPYASRLKRVSYLTLRLLTIIENMILLICWPLSIILTRLLLWQI